MTKPFVKKGFQRKKRWYNNGRNNPTFLITLLFLGLLLADFIIFFYDFSVDKVNLSEYDFESGMDSKFRYSKEYKYNKKTSINSKTINSLPGLDLSLSFTETPAIFYQEVVKYLSEKEKILDLAFTNSLTSNTFRFLSEPFYQTIISLNQKKFGRAKDLYLAIEETTRIETLKYEFKTQISSEKFLANLAIFLGTISKPEEKDFLLALLRSCPDHIASYYLSDAINKMETNHLKSDKE